MIERDAWARETPYELGLPGRAFAEEAFGAIRDEAQTRSVDDSDPGAFILLGEVGRAVQAIRARDRGGDALHRYAAFLFHAYHFHRSGEHVLLLGEAAARALVAPDRDGGSWTGALPSPAGYLQLPRHLFWSSPGGSEGDDAAGDAVPEPIDGIFWSASSGDTLSLLVAMGVRGGRPGLSLMDLPPVGLDEARSLTAAKVRESGPDFRTTLPGGEIDELHSIVTLGEALKLAARVFGFVEERPETLGEEEVAPKDVDGASALPFRRIAEFAGGSGRPVSGSPDGS